MNFQFLLWMHSQTASWRWSLGCTGGILGLGVFLAEYLNKPKCFSSLHTYKRKENLLSSENLRTTNTQHFKCGVFLFRLFYFVCNLGRNCKHAQHLFPCFVCPHKPCDVIFLILFPPPLYLCFSVLLSSCTWLQQLGLMVCTRSTKSVWSDGLWCFMIIFSSQWKY